MNRRISLQQEALSSSLGASAGSIMRVDPPRIACIMVGLPARGKTFIAQKVSRYLNWLGIETRVWNVGNYRRKLAGAQQPHQFYDPHNKEASELRKAAAVAALDDMLKWLSEPSAAEDPQIAAADRAYIAAALATAAAAASQNKSPESMPSLPATASSTFGRRSARHSGRQSPTGSVYSLRTIPEEQARVAIYDATNSTLERRELIRERCALHGVVTIFIESVCSDQRLITESIQEVKLSSPDYLNCDPVEAAADFQERIRHYQDAYVTMGGDDGTKETDSSYIKLIDTGSRYIINNVHGYVQSRVGFFLMNLHIAPRSILMCRHGESMFNVAGKIGGDADLSPRGQAFARAMPHIIKANISQSQDLTVWTSTLRRTIQTSEHLDYPKLQWKALDEIDAGVCDGMTYEEIEKAYPDDFAERDKDKFSYRYVGGESYKDLVLRLEPIIMELERQRSILIIGHQAVLRAIYAYFLNLPHDKLPYVHVPLHTVIKLTPKAYGCEEETFSLPIEAVDTHRPRATRKHRSSNGNTSPVHVLQGPYGNSVGAGPASPNLPAVTIEEGGSAEQLVAPMVVDNHVTGSKIAADAASSTSTASTSITPGAPSSNIIEEQLSVVQIDHDEVLVPRDRIDDHTETLRVTHRLRRSPFAERGGAGGMLRVKQFESAEELVRAGGESEMKVDADNAGAEKDVNLSPGSPLRKLAREANPKE